MLKIKKYILSLMEDKSNGPFDVPFKIILFVLSIVYSFSLKVINLFYLLGLKGVFAVDVPVISVGNITLGGTGKTPFTIFLARFLISKGKNPAVLTRGYGEDEYKLLEEKLGADRVFVGADRVLSSYYATRKGYDVIILDDGFQHKRIKRDMDIVLLDTLRPFGNGYLFPRGILREEPAALKRAHMILFTKSDYTGGVTDMKALNINKHFKDNVITGEISYEARSLKDITGREHGLDLINGKALAAVSGIAHNGYFVFMLGKLGARSVEALNFTDHHDYTSKDIAAIDDFAGNKDSDLIITTEKDFVKLKDLGLERLKGKLYVLAIDVKITKGEGDIIAGLSRFYTGQGS